MCGASGAKTSLSHRRFVWTGQRSPGETSGMRRMPVLVLGGATAIAAGVVLARRRKEDDGGFRIPDRTMTRNAQLAGMGTRLTGTIAANRARRIFASAERKEQLDEELQFKTAEQVAATLGNMKGAMMKLGQMVSYVDETLPAPIREQL